MKYITKEVRIGIAGIAAPMHIGIWYQLPERYQYVQTVQLFLRKVP